VAKDGVKQPFPRRCIGISEAKKGAALQRIFLTSDKDEEEGHSKSRGLCCYFSFGMINA
jgi:hypothetical protein